MLEGIGTTKEMPSQCLIGCVKLSWFDSAPEGDKGRLRGKTQEVRLLLLVLNYKQGETDFWIGYNVLYKWDDFWNNLYVGAVNGLPGWKKDVWIGSPSLL